MPQERPVKKAFKNVPKDKKVRWKERKKWLDDGENDLKKMVLGAGEK
jgi:hypothetical protein